MVIAIFLKGVKTSISPVPGAMLEAGIQRRMVDHSAVRT